MTPYEIHNKRRELVLDPMDPDKSPGRQLCQIVLDEINLALSYLDTLYDEMLDEEPFFRFFALISRSGVEYLKRALGAMLNMQPELQRPELQITKKVLTRRYEKFCKEVDELDRRLRISYTEQPVFPLWLDSEDDNSYIASAKNYQLEWVDGAVICLTDLDKRVRYGQYSNSYHQLRVSKLALPDDGDDINRIHEMLDAWCDGNEEKIKYTLLDLRHDKQFYYSPLSLNQMLRPLSQLNFELKRKKNVEKYDDAQMYYQDAIARVFDEVECRLMDADFDLIESEDDQAGDVETAKSRYEEAKLHYVAARINAQFLLRDYRKWLPELRTLIMAVNPYGDNSAVLGHADSSLDGSFSHALRNNYDSYVRFKEVPSPLSPHISVMEFGFADGSGLEIALFPTGNVEYSDVCDWPESKDSSKLFRWLNEYCYSDQFYPRQRDEAGLTVISSICRKLADLVQEL